MKDLMIRRAVEADLPAINRLLVQVHRIHSEARPDLFRSDRPGFSPDAFAKMLADASRLILVAEKFGQVLGYLFCVSKPNPDRSLFYNIKTLSIEDLCVDEAARHEHIGARLCEYVFDYGRKQGFYNVVLNVWADNNTALRFYEQIGMKVQKIGMETIL